MQMSMRWCGLAAVAASTLLSGCATTWIVDNRVQTFSQLQTAPSPATYRFERLPSQQAQPQQAQMLEDVARPAIEGAGLVAAPEGVVPDVTVQVGARISETALSPYDDPFWYGGYGGYGSGIRSYTEYHSQIGLHIRQNVTNAPLFDGRAMARSRTNRLEALLPSLVDAMFTGFPGQNGETVKITIPEVRS